MFKAQNTEQVGKSENSFWPSEKVLLYLEADNSIIPASLWTSELLTIK
jgi:hypothetical protein